MYAPYNLSSGFLRVAGLTVNLQWTCCKNCFYLNSQGLLTELYDNQGIAC